MTNLLAGKGKGWAVQGAAVAGLALLLGGCGAGNNNMLVAPGKYQLFDCIQLKQAAAGYLARERELREVMTKAEQSPGGGIASVLGYRNEYMQVQGNLEQLRLESTAKKCSDPPPGLFGPAPAAPRR